MSNPGHLESVFRTQDYFKLFAWKDLKIETCWALKITHHIIQAALSKVHLLEICLLFSTSTGTNPSKARKLVEYNYKCFLQRNEMSLRKLLVVIKSWVHPK